MKYLYRQVTYITVENLTTSPRTLATATKQPFTHFKYYIRGPNKIRVSFNTDATANSGFTAASSFDVITTPEGVTIDTISVQTVAASATGKLYGEAWK